MYLYGKRSDGALCINLGGGVGVVLLRALSTAPMDFDTLVKKFGPFDTETVSPSDRRDLRLRLNATRVAPASTFHLGDRSKYPGGKYPNEGEGGSKSSSGRAPTLRDKVMYKGKLHEVMGVEGGTGKLSISPVGPNNQIEYGMKTVKPSDVEVAKSESGGSKSSGSGGSSVSKLDDEELKQGLAKVESKSSAPKKSASSASNDAFRRRMAARAAAPKPKSSVAPAGKKTSAAAPRRRSAGFIKHPYEKRDYPSD
jgi:hypothetical protein